MLFPSMTEKTQFPGFTFPKVVQTLVRRGEITNHHSIAYSLRNISAKNNQNRLMCVEVVHCVSKNDNDVLCYNFNAHQAILKIFGRDIAE